MKKTISILLLAQLWSCERNLAPLEINYSSSTGIVYNKQIQNRWQIILNNIEGSQPLNISNNPTDDAYNPRWSPDGNYIAFRYDRVASAGSDIYLYDVNDRKTENLTPEFGPAESASPKLWSPNSRKLVYHYHMIGEPSWYCIMQSDGSQKRKLQETESTEIIAFCDHGNSVIYAKSYFLYKKNIETESVESILNLRETGGYTTWVDDYDPMSNTLLCHEDSSTWNSGATYLIKKLNLNSMLTDTLVVAKEGTKLLRPIFANDYSKIAFIEHDYVNHISKIILLENGQRIELNKLTKNNEAYSFYRIEFSPYDTYITYTVSVVNSGDWFSQTSYVYILNIATKEAHFIDQGQDSQWNPLNSF